jgi:hypothetical protein
MLVDNLVSPLAELALSFELSRTLGAFGGRINAAHHSATTTTLPTIDTTYMPVHPSPPVGVYQR